MASDLSARQIEILQMAADGFDCNDTAATLEICVSKVKNYRHEAMNKLGADNTTNAVAMALRRGIIK